MDGWYYKVFGAEFGPVTFDELVELAKKHSLSSNDDVRLGEGGNWRRAGSIGKLMAHLPFESGTRVITATASSSPSEIENDSTLEDSREMEWTRSDSVAQPETVKAPENDTRWSYKFLGQEYGPITFEELVGLAKNQSISSDDEVRFGESGIWRRAGSIGQLMAHFPFQAGKRVISPTPGPPVSEIRTEPRTQPETEVSSSPAGPSAPATKSTESDTRWWCKIHGDEYGPVGLSKIMDWATSGRLHPEDYVRNGLEPYILASDLPGLFPASPTADTRSEMTSKSGTRPFSTQNSSLAEPKPARSPVKSTPASDAAIVAPAAVDPPIPEPAAAVSRPVGGMNGGGGGGFGGGSGAMNRPVVPIRRPPPKKSSGSPVDMLLSPPVLGIGGVIVLAVLIYFGWSYIPMGESADAKKFLAMKKVYHEMQTVKNGENSKPEELKPFSEKFATVAKPIETELAKNKKKTSAQQKLLEFAKNLQKLGKEDLTKPTDPKIAEIEKTINKVIPALAKMLKVK
jgi:hypothetical protein